MLEYAIETDLDTEEEVPMTSRERLECVFTGQKPDRYPAYEHFWGEALDRWENEGLPKSAREDIDDYFDLDIGNCGGFDLTAQFPSETLSEDDTYKVIKDSRGVIAQVHKSESGHTPHWLETPIKTPSDWWNYKERLAFNEDRIDRTIFDRARLLRERGRFVCPFLAESYEQAWPVFGQVQMFMAMLEEPDVVKDSLDTWANLTIECLDYCIREGLDIDGVWFYGDMGYSNGTLFSPEVYQNLVMPAHKKVVNYVHDLGKKVILHSCGQIKSFIPMLIEVGFDALQPLEAKCDQDVRELVKIYDNQIVFFGNIDVRALSADKETIKNEIESKLAAFDGRWNYIFHSDHSIPQTVSYENYTYALELARGFLERR